MGDLRPQIGHKPAQGRNRAIDQLVFAGLVVFRIQVGPIAVIRVGAGHHVAAVGTRPGLGIIKRIRPACDIPAQQQIGAKLRRGGRKHHAGNQ